jgi:predicted RNA-binding Zn ribbon-like protein
MSRRRLEPGERMPAPDPGLRLVQAFVNTIDFEDAEDSLSERARVGTWLADTGLVDRPIDISPAEHARLLAVREGFRRLGSANNGEPLRPGERDQINRLLAPFVLVPVVTKDGQLRVEAKGRDLDAAIGRLLEIVARAGSDGTWLRMKACRMHSCRWLFWDASRNRSGTWCTMSLCGSRQKSRTYRRRMSKRRSGALTSAFPAVPSNSDS